MTASSSAYTITEALSSAGSARMYRAVRNVDRHPVLLKVLDPQRRLAQDLDRLKQEFQVGTLLGSSANIRPLAFETHEGMPALVLEDFGGRSLDGLLGAAMPVDRFTAIAIRIAGAVANIHEQGVVHRDLKPSNIFVNLTSGEVKIADFGIASQLPRAHQRPQASRHIQGSLPYLSPEQTGRTNRSIDARSDLYSLGITFHEMLTGRLPFVARDPLEWVHCHIARTPPSPSEIVPQVPEAISRIVRKLLAKIPEERYQTARGLRVDLEGCRHQLSTRGVIEPFPLGQMDISGRLQIPQKLYGREAETVLLRQAFSRVVETGTPQLLLVSGYSGIGKSTLVHELYEPVVRERGFFVSGKFDESKRDIPHATLVQAFSALVHDILAESEARIAAFRTLLLGALGTSGQLIIDVIPSVELIIGRQPPVPELPPLEAKNRFRTLLRNFIGVFAQKLHPLVLFLDDLQWADLASLALLEDLLAHAEPGHLLVVAAYRENEVTPSHPLVRALDEVRRAGARVSEIVLGPIPADRLAAFVGEAVHCSAEEAAPLAELVHHKTGGNPFFAIQFMSALAEEHLIQLDEQRGVFRWDIGKIREKGFTDNVADLLIGKLRRLSPGTQEALRQLACLGNSAEVALLKTVLGGSEHDTHAALWEAGAAGLVLRGQGTYKFLHDRIQEAAYSLTPEADRAAAHLRLGRLLAAQTPPEALEQKIFEIVNQLNRAVPLITSPEERERLAELNLLAGARAKRAMAYASALRYFGTGADLMQDAWERRYDLAFALELQRAECEFLTAAHAAEEERLTRLRARARTLVDVAAVTCAQIVLHTTLARSDRAVEACLEYLHRVGVDWSPRPGNDEVQREYARMWETLGSRPIESLVDLPAVTDPECRATMDVLTRSQSAALFTDENLHCLVVGRMANISFAHGNSDGSCLAYIRLGSLLGPRFGDYRAGFRFGKLGLDLVEKRDLLRFKARAYLDFGYLVHPWTRHVRSSLEILRRGFETAQETGDLMYASYAGNRITSLLLAAGESLSEVEAHTARALEFARSARFALVVDILTAQLGLIRTLRGLTPVFSSFSDAQLDEGAFERRLADDRRLSLPACWYWIRKLQARYFAGDPTGALAAAAQAERLLWTSPSFFEMAEYHWYRALAVARLPDAASDDRRRELDLHRQQLEVWAENCPENFESRAALVGAELARLEADPVRAAELYEQAIRSAREGGFLPNEAISYETAARFYSGRGFELIAETYLREACDRYLRWGAEGKVRQLEQLFPQLVSRQPLTAGGTLTIRAEQLDLQSVTKASQTISGEILLDQLLRTMLAVVLEQGGAQRGSLILRRDGALSIEAEASLQDSGPVSCLLGPVPVEASGQLPTSLIHYVQRTKEWVILGDAAAHAGKFAGDEYLRRVRPKSVLCMPILRQAEVVGLLYLENNLLTGAFTPERLAALELCATQAAISLQNAMLHANEQLARAAAENAERRAAFLAEAGSLLSESLNYEETLDRLARLYVRGPADWCVIDVVEGREIVRLAVAHADPARDATIKELQRRYPPRWDSAHPAARVLRSGQPILMPDATDDLLRTICENEEHLELVRTLGTRTGVAVPLVVRGQTLGVLSFASAAPGRRYGRADLDLAEAVAARAAFAIDNARLYRASQEAVRARDEFLNVASHELNTPVASLMLAVHAVMDATPAQQPVDTEALHRLFGIVHRQGSRLSKLISNLLDVSRIEASRLPFELSEVDLGQLVREVVHRLEVDLTRARCPIEIEGDGLPFVGRWDRSRIDQVVTNVLSNAIKFGAGHPIELSITSEPHLARLAVRDHGIGMDPKQTSRVFGRFERAVSERNYGGLGLGLYICRRIVEGHGGSIRCDSEPEGGCLFTIELPWAGPRLNRPDPLTAAPDS